MATLTGPVIVTAPPQAAVKSAAALQSAPIRLASASFNPVPVTASTVQQTRKESWVTGA